jgi:hypothetical protein
MVLGTMLGEGGMMEKWCSGGGDPSPEIDDRTTVRLKNGCLSCGSDF